MMSFHRNKAWILWLGFCLLLAPAAARAAVLQDLFANREVVDTAAGSLDGNNAGATAEDGEPQHGGRHPSHSLWVTWVAPANGLATVNVSTTTFHTLLGVYRLKVGGGPPIKLLDKIAGAVDNRGGLGSLVQFGVRAGDRYEIAVDGLDGATGAFTLSWKVDALKDLLPITVQTPDDESVHVGDTVTLTAQVDAVNQLKLRWFFNEVELPESDGPSLVLPNFQPLNAGQYQVRVDVAGTRFFSQPVEVQITSEGDRTLLARNTPEDALASGIGGVGAASLGVRRAAPADAGGVTRGYNGTQIFHTIYAGRDPGEPLHCGIAGGASYWYSYIPPADGVASMDTDGSDFDTVLAVYTFDPPLLGYPGLQPVVCDNDSGANGRTSRLQFTAAFGRTYLVVIDGVGGAKGLAYLNYKLATNAPPVVGPRLTLVPATAGLTLQFPVAAGTRFVLESGPGPAGPWAPWPVAPTPQNGVVTVAVATDDSARFLRVTLP